MKSEINNGHESIFSHKDYTSVKKAENVQTKLFKRRWLMLITFALLSGASGFQWIQYSIISNIIMKFYGVSSLTVNYTSMIFLIVNIILVFPGLYIIEKKGLRFTTILGSFGTALGAIIKVVSATPERFYITFIGQTITGASQVFIVSVTSRLAATWFGPKEKSTACSIGCFGLQSGVALGFVLTPILVNNSDNLEDIGNDLYLFFIVQATITSVIFIIILIFFEREPPLPPSRSQAYKKKEETTNKEFINSFKRLLFNRGFMCLFLSFGIDLAIFSTLSTLLNQCLLLHFPNGEQFAGRIGLIMVLSGTLGAIGFGFILDLTKKYKETSVIIYIFTALGMFAYTFSLDAESYTLLYVTSGILGLFNSGFLSVGFEFCAEITYPEPESSSSGLLLMSLQSFGIIFILTFGYLIPIIGVFWTNICLAGFLTLGIIITALIPNDLRRQKANINKCHFDIL